MSEEKVNYLGGSLVCRRCGERMRPGKYIAQTMVGGMPDFPGDTHPSTFSAGGPGVLADCLKCPDCGHSVTLTGDDLGKVREPKWPGWWIETRPLWLRLILYVTLTVVAFGVMSIAGVLLMAATGALLLWLN